MSLLLQLSEDFYYNNKRKQPVKVQVKLNADGIHFRRETGAPPQPLKVSEQRIDIRHIFGSRCGTRLEQTERTGLISCRQKMPKHFLHENVSDAEEDKDNSAYLYVYAYVKLENPARRIRNVRILRFRAHEKYEENLKTAERWHQTIGALATALNGECSMSGVSGVRRSAEVLILLNPKSGTCRARELFQQQVVPVLHEAGLSYDLHITEHANYARELVRCKQDLWQRYGGIIVAAGDGLFYEVLNGLMERNDWRTMQQRCCHMPLGIIPCGSGNGLAKSIAHLYDEPYAPKPILYSSLTCVSGCTAPMDVVRIEYAPKSGADSDGDAGASSNVTYSFLSVGWGLIADIDIESEHLRAIGAQRFKLWSIRRLLNLRTHKGKLYYRPWQKSAATNGEFYDMPDDEFTDCVSLEHRSSSRPHIDSWYSATSYTTNFYSITPDQRSSIRSQSSKVLAAAAVTNDNNGATIGEQPKMPPLHMPLPPEGWHCIEDEFVMVHAAYVTHLASDCLFVPMARLNDGIIHLIVIRAGVGRQQLAQFLLNLSTGTHLPTQPNEYIQLLTVTAFRIEPHSSDVEGILAVDGERVAYGTIQGEMLPGLIRIMVPK